MQAGKLTGLGIDRQEGFNRYSPILSKQLKKDLSHLDLVLLTNATTDLQQFVKAQHTTAILSSKECSLPSDIK